MALILASWPAPKKPMVKEAGIVRDSVMRLLGPVVLLILYNDGLLNWMLPIDFHGK